MFILLKQQEISKNYLWLRAICEENPEKALCSSKLGPLFWAAPFFHPSPEKQSTYRSVSPNRGVTGRPHILGLGDHCWMKLSWGVPWQVPSGFYLADSVLRLDSMFKGYLLVPPADCTKAEQAGKEAKRMKRLMGALRHLYRNSPWVKA